MKWRYSMAVKKVLVYQSKDEQDWEKAKGILAEGGIGFHDWASEEVGACGCGAKLDIRKFGRKEPIPTRIFHIEVEPVDLPNGQRIGSTCYEQLEQMLAYCRNCGNHGSHITHFFFTDLAAHIPVIQPYLLFPTHITDRNMGILAFCTDLVFLLSCDTKLHKI